MAARRIGGMGGGNRVFGLSGSGVDVDEVVANMMQAAKKPKTKLEQQRNLLEWKKKSYNDMLQSISEFRNNRVFNFTLQKTVGAKNVTNNVPGVASATANADARDGIHSLQVFQLACGAAQMSFSPITPKGAGKSCIEGQFGLKNNFELKINGQVIKVDVKKSINELALSITKANTGLVAPYDAIQDRFFLQTKSSGENSQINYDGNNSAAVQFLTQHLKLSPLTQVGNKGVESSKTLGIDVTATLSSQFKDLKGSFRINVKNAGSVNHEISVNAGQTSVNDFLKSLNSLKGADGMPLVSADYKQGKISIKALSTGSFFDFSQSDATGLNFLQEKLHLNQQTGQNAKLLVDGAYFEQAENQFKLNHISYSLQGVGTANLQVKTDTEKIIEEVKNFVKDYNTLLSSAVTLHDEKHDRSFQPLTDEQKTAMKESEIVAWTKKAQLGLLRRDQRLNNLVNGMRNIVLSRIEGIEGKYHSAASIGITTGDWTEKGKLHLDEAKLRKALDEDPDVVRKIFGTTQSEKNSSVSHQGIAPKLHGFLKIIEADIIKEAGTTPSMAEERSSLGRKYKLLKTQMALIDQNLRKQENRYYTRFARMENILAKLNQQAARLGAMTAK